MATAYTRPKTAREFFDLEKFNKGGSDYKSVVAATVNIASWTTTTYLTYNDVYFGTGIICSGAVLLIDSQVGILMSDTAEGDTGHYLIEADMIMMPLKAADSPAVGDILYWDATNEHLTLTPSTFTKCAVSLKVKEAFVTGNADRMPVGTFILVRKTFS